jgi:hypothetical protein
MAGGRPAPIFKAGQRKEGAMAKRGGEEAKAGFYWRAAAWEIVTLSGKGGVLPGGVQERYYRLPALAVLTAAPVMGGLFVVFLPFIGFALLFGHLGRAGAGAARRGWARLSAHLRHPRHA